MSLETTRILLAEDSPSDADLLQEKLDQSNLGRVKFTWVVRLEDALARLRQAEFDVLLLDLSLPDSTGAASYLRVRQAAPNLPIVVLTGAEDEALGLDAVRHGVQDYLAKGRADGRQIARSIRYAIERQRADEQIRRQLEELQSTNERVVAARRAAIAVAEEALASRREAERASTELRRLNRTLKALSGSSQAMMRATDEAGYLQEVCSILQRDCGYAMIWIGYARQDERRTVGLVAQAGFDDGYLEKLELTWADSERGRGPTGTAIRTRQPAGCRNMLTDPNFAPWRDEAVRRGYASSLAVPLVAEAQTLGAVTIYSREPDPFPVDEVKLLTELADDMTYGIISLRLRAAHAEAEKALRAERDAVMDREQELAAIYENAPLIMLLVDGERRVQKANRQAEVFAGTSLTDLLGRRGGEVLRCLHSTEDIRGCGFGPFCQHCILRRTIAGTIETGRGHHHVEVSLAAGSGHALPNQTFLLSTARLNLRGKPLALVTMQDITSRKQAEEALQRIRAELEVRVADRTARLRALAAELTQSEERERRRIAQILHDNLQQLLVGARLRLEAVRGRSVSKPIADDLQQIERLITESGDVARDLSHELSPTVLHEHGLVPGLQWLSRWMNEKHGLDVRVEAHTAAEGLEADVKVLLYQSVRELLFNVVKHSGVKRASVRIDPAASDSIEVVVGDKGRGIDPAPSRASQDANAGFGLFGIRERLASVGGRMEIENEPGGGCRFRLIAPLQGPPSDRTPAAVTQRTQKQRASRRRPMDPQEGPRAKVGRQGATIRVLLADDHKIVRDGLAVILNTQSGIEVVGLAADGQEAVSLTGKLQPQVVVMDVSMPLLDGIAATRQIAAAWPHVKVIGLTMHADEASRDAMRAAGAVDCLVKTGPTDDLVNAICAATGSVAPWPTPAI